MPQSFRINPDSVESEALTAVRRLLSTTEDYNPETTFHLLGVTSRIVWSRYTFTSRRYMAYVEVSENGKYEVIVDDGNTHHRTKAKGRDIRKLAS